MTLAELERGAEDAMASGAAVENKLILLMRWLPTVFVTLQVHSGKRTPADIAADGTCWCDQFSTLFLYLAWRLLRVDGHGYSIVHANGSDGHTMPEVRYWDGWHLFDVQHGLIYRAADGHIMGRDELRADQSPVIAVKHWWRKGQVGLEGFFMPGAVVTVETPMSSERTFVVD